MENKKKKTTKTARGKIKGSRYTLEELETLTVIAESAGEKLAEFQRNATFMRANNLAEEQKLMNELKADSPEQAQKLIREIIHGGTDSILKSIEKLTLLISKGFELNGKLHRKQIYQKYYLDSSIMDSVEQSEEEHKQRAKNSKSRTKDFMEDVDNER